MFPRCKVNRTVRQIAQLSLTMPARVLFTAHFRRFDQLGSDLLTSRGEAERLRQEPLTKQMEEAWFLDASFVINLILLDTDAVVWWMQGHLML